MNLDNTDLATAVSGMGNDPIGEQWSMSLVEQLTSLEGRINRLRYLLLNIMMMIGGVVYGLFVGIILAILLMPVILIVGDLPLIIFNFFALILTLPLAYVGYAMVVKRLQDSGRAEGWITYAQVTIVLNLISILALDTDFEMTSGLIVSVIAIPLGIVCLFFKGENGPNRFGPDPLG